MTTSTPAGAVHRPPAAPLEPGTIVSYHGRRPAAWGTYVIAGPCRCRPNRLEDCAGRYKLLRRGHPSGPTHIERNDLTPFEGHVIRTVHIHLCFGPGDVVAAAPVIEAPLAPDAQCPHPEQHPFGAVYAVDVAGDPGNYEVDVDHLRRSAMVVGQTRATAHAILTSRSTARPVG